jgi:hypothetical protein
MMNSNTPTSDSSRLDSEQLAREVLGLLRDERQQDILARRLGLFGVRETYAAIASSVGVTGQAVQKFVISDMWRLRRLSNEGRLDHITRPPEAFLVETLQSRSGAIRLSDLTSFFGSGQGSAPENRIAFLATFCPTLTVIADDTKHHGCVLLSRVIDKPTLDALIGEIITTLATADAPLSIAALTAQLGGKNARRVPAAVSVSKQFRRIGDLWGLVSWPIMDARFIQGRIYAVLKFRRAPMHFTAIAHAVNADTAGHKLSVSGVHNELGRNPAFVRVGRGLYALAEDGYENRSGTELVAKILREAGRPLEAGEIVTRVHSLNPYLKEGSIRQYLSKPQFRRVRRGTYELAVVTKSEDAAPHTQQ